MLEYLGRCLTLSSSEALPQPLAHSTPTAEHGRKYEEQEKTRGLEMKAGKIIQLLSWVKESEDKVHSYGFGC